SAKSTPAALHGKVGCGQHPSKRSLDLRRVPVSDPTPSSSSAPIYADRNSGEKFADATQMVNAYLARYAESGAHRQKVTLDETGYAQLQRGSATIGVNVLEDQGVLMVFAPVMPIPVTGREPFFRRLLELSFVTTSDAAFAINSHQNDVVVRSL